MIGESNNIALEDSANESKKLSVRCDCGTNQQLSGEDSYVKQSERGSGENMFPLPLNPHLNADFIMRCTLRLLFVCQARNYGNKVLNKNGTQIGKHHLEGQASALSEI
ncbi:unnamed protein product [Hymenolepis diminuta]|uniref:Uncharacterized protein n=1 Tax=Hymenolepis diminuta TaxID=6216 RepID=A0A564YQ37_HYMDI|nr:unnamed protein product [Hymenolepis diminuta]